MDQGAFAKHQPAMAAVLIVCAWTAAARAQSEGAMNQREQPVAIESLTSNSPLGSDWGRGLVLSGFGVANWSYDANTRDSSFDGSALALSLFKTLPGRFSVFAQLTAAREAASPFVGAEEGGGTTETGIDNLQLRWVPSPAAGLDLVLGKFDSPLALERDDAPLNYQATSSFVFDFARPVKFTGLALHEAFSPSFEAWAIVANGWDLDHDNNHGKTAALYGLWSPALAAHIGLGIVHGPEKDGTTADPRTTAIATLLFQPAAHWVWGGETVAGEEPHSAVGGGTAHWFGQTLFLHLRCPAPSRARWAGTVRLEYLGDRDGARTGIAQTLRSLTLSPQLLLGGGFFGLFRQMERTSLRLPEVAVRLDLRYDRSSVEAFRGRSQEETKRGHASATLQTVFLF